MRGLRLRDRLWIRAARRPLPVWYAPEYRLPMSGVEAAAGLEQIGRAHV